MGLKVPRLELNSARLRAKYGSLLPLFTSFVTLFIIFYLSIIVYMVLEGWNFLDSLYMVIITLSTVGFGEVRQLSPMGRLFTSILILLGVGNFMFIAGAFSQLLLEGKVQRYMRRRSLTKTISKLENHYIVCGYGRIGQVVVQQIMDDGHDVVVIEMDNQTIEELEEQGIPYLQGDATDDLVLETAGLGKAKCLIAALNKDSANVFVVLTARQLNPTLNIISRAETQAHINRLERAGADRVVMPHMIGGLRMAQMVLRPTVTSFMDVATRGGMDLQMEEFLVTPGSDLVDKNLIESEIRKNFNVIVIAIKGRDGAMSFNPPADYVIKAWDILLVVGMREKLTQLKEIC